jgi:hypothetical protein
VSVASEQESTANTALNSAIQHRLQAMKSVLGGVSSPPRRAFPRVISYHNLFLINDTTAKSISKPWVCQHCRHYNEQFSDLNKRRLRLLPIISPLHQSRRTQIHRKNFSTSPPRTQMKDTNHASDKPRNDLPSQEEGRRSHLSKRFNHVMDHLQSNIFIAGQRLNDLTGYSGIEALKKDIEEQGWPTP